MDSLAASLATLPSFFLYFVGGVGLIASFTILYARVTPHPEFALIRSGNIAAAIGVAGAQLGFVIPLAAVITNSVSLVDLMAWGVVALLVQLGGYLCARLIFPDLTAAIAEGRISQAIFLAGLSLSLGVLTAACMAG